MQLGIMLLMKSGTDEKVVSVEELRKELKKRKLDMDGSKQTLVSMLEEAIWQRTE